VLQHWLGNDRVASVRVLELSSYHAIVACVASGTGVALAPESVLDTVQHAAVARHKLPKVHGQLTTPLIWRAADASTALLALRKVLASVTRRPAPPGRRTK